MRFPPCAGAAIVLAGVIFAAPGCDSGNGAPPVRVFFGTNNLAPCHSYRVELDLDAADAVPARLHDGSVDCSLDPLLAARGCSIDFIEADDGSTLTVAIDDCDLENATLFDCGFSQPDVERLNAAAKAHCFCSTQPVCIMNGPTCYSLPGVCVTEDPSGWGCEDCYNGVDDDGDGKTDCQDGNCFLECGVGQTTVTCSSSSTTVTTTSVPVTTVP